MILQDYILHWLSHSSRGLWKSGIGLDASVVGLEDGPDWVCLLGGFRCLHPRGSAFQGVGRPRARTEAAPRRPRGCSACRLGVSQPGSEHPLPKPALPKPPSAPARRHFGRCERPTHSPSVSLSMNAMLNGRARGPSGQALGWRGETTVCE